MHKAWWFAWALLVGACSDDATNGGSGGAGDGTGGYTSGDTAQGGAVQDAGGSVDSAASLPVRDGDGDGWLVPLDCNDSDPAINGDAKEVPDNGIDDNCNGEIDEAVDTDTPPTTFAAAELWYSSDTWLVYIQIDPADGTVTRFEASEITGLPRGQNCITQLPDGSLLGARLAKADMQTHFYYLPDPPRDGAAVTPVDLGVMPEGIMLEGLYTDCEGRIYGMDTGEDDGSAAGNRLIRFTGDVLSGDFSYQVISDLSSAVVADIDDLGPGIDAEGHITDNPGLAIDTGTIYDFNYETGTGTQVGTGGTFGIHVLGGDLFDDGVARAYVLDSQARLFLLDLTDFSLSDPLMTGPEATTAGDMAGWSSLTGPLTACETGFTVQ